MQPFERKPVDALAATSQAAESRPAVPQLGDKLGVLVVGDEHLVRVTVQLGLERNGFEVWLAANGREALRLYRRHRDHIAMVLLDACMPGLDAPATVDALRKPNPEVRVYFMSYDTGGCEPEELRQRGAAYVIAKPFLVNEMANILGLLAKGMSADVPPSGGGSRG
jgi:CheY-like chemotaxis protein